MSSSQQQLQQQQQQDNSDNSERSLSVEVDPATRAVDDAKRGETTTTTTPTPTANSRNNNNISSSRFDEVVDVDDLLNHQQQQGANDKDEEAAVAVRVTHSPLAAQNDNSLHNRETVHTKNVLQKPPAMDSEMNSPPPPKVEPESALNKAVSFCHSVSVSVSVDGQEEDEFSNEDILDLEPSVKDGGEDDMDGSWIERAMKGGRWADGSKSARWANVFARSQLHWEQPEGVEGIEEEPIFGEDAYSLIGTAPIFSQAAAFAWFVIMLQGGMLLVTFLDLLDFSNEPYSINGVVNRMQIPAGASIYVTVSQFLGLLLTVLVMAAEGDLVLGAQQLLKGYDKRITEQSPNCNFAKWLFTGLFQATAGALLLLNSFILSMRSTTVIDLALNLTALHFLQEFDEKAFEIATETGLLGPKIKEECEHVQDLTHFTTPKTRQRYLMWRRILIGFMSVFLLVPYFIVVSWQNNGRFMCSTLYIQFGDAFFPEMAHYSGLFYTQGNSFGNRLGGRAYYVDGTNTLKVSYCVSDQAWTISRLADSPCDYMFKSPDTDTFDVIEVANTDWLVATEGAGDVAVGWLKIGCNDCNEERCNADYGTCSEAGDQCVCKEGRFGVNCQFEEKCMWFALDERTRAGLASIPGTAPLLSQEYVSASYERSGMSFYDRPVYVPSHHKTYKADQDVNSFIIFSGRRWIIYAIPDENLKKLVEANGKPSNWTSAQFFSDFEHYNTNTNHFRAMQQLQSELVNYFPIFFSTPVDYGEESDGVDPSTVTWMFAQETSSPELDVVVPRRPDEQQRLSAKLLCSDCEDGTACKNGGYCDLPDGECICSTFYAGYQCERVKDCVEAGGCNGAGKCNEVTRTCECDEGSFGTLCQLGANKLDDEFLCTHCNLHGQGECNGTFSQQCTCQEGYYGVFCNETDSPL